MLIRDFKATGLRRGLRFDSLLLAQAFCLILSILLLSACSSYLNIQYGPEVIINSVPFYPQEDFQCGPSSLAGVLNYLGVNVTPKEIASEIYSASAKGTLDMDLLFYAQKMGLRAERYRGNIDDLKEKIRAGHPLIVLVDYGYGPIQVNHFMVVTGFNDSGIFANSGREERKFIHYKDFLRLWERTGFWTLLIMGKGYEGE